MLEIIQNLYFSLTYQVDVAELIQPEVVDGGGAGRELVLLKGLITEAHGVGESAQNPLVHRPLVTHHLRIIRVTRNL